MAKKKKRDELVFLEDILECINRIQQYTKNLAAADFEKNTEKQDAVIRRIEIIGEAVKNVSMETRTAYPHIPWKEMAGMRDIVIHQYFGVSVELVWRVAIVDLPNLKDDFIKIIEDKQQ